MPSIGAGRFSLNHSRPRIGFIGASLYSYQWLCLRDVTWITDWQSIGSADEFIGSTLQF
jgi:hypothetical protein